VGTGFDSARPSWGLEAPLLNPERKDDFLVTIADWPASVAADMGDALAIGGYVYLSVGLQRVRREATIELIERVVSAIRMAIVSV
jgi:hypothetical protein